MTLLDSKISSRRTISGGLVYGNSVTVAISSNVDNLVIPDLENTVLVRLDVSGNRSITGIIPVNTDDAQEIRVFNVGTGNLSFKDNDSGSDPENRFLLGGDKNVQSDEGLTLIYDPDDDRWRATGIII